MLLLDTGSLERSHTAVWAAKSAGLNCSAIFPAFQHQIGRPSSMVDKREAITSVVRPHQGFQGFLQMPLDSEIEARTVGFRRE